MSTTVDYLLLRHSESIYFEPNSIPRLPEESFKNLANVFKNCMRFLGRQISKLITLNLNPQTPKAFSKSPYAQIGVKGLY